ncbi:hypothetical protein T12_1415 [Trichinella patagoniensis]|uniref:Uncharacterized protein n=1 Tax=Trichinella patagoniensis TaxID=990121 RepID=A0A0V0XDH2_9BILA|nr:hypothetical protein T12_1415 [Trichinella patagoniensis]
MSASPHSSSSAHIMANKVPSKLHISSKPADPHPTVANTPD